MTETWMTEYKTAMTTELAMLSEMVEAGSMSATDAADRIAQIVHQLTMMGA